MLRHMLMKHSGCGFYFLSLALFLSGCGQGTTERASSQSSLAEVRPGGPSCEERSLDAPPDSAISWANYLRHGDRVYSATFEGQPAKAVAPAARLGKVTCKRSNSVTPVNHVLRDGEAAYVELGTPFHAVDGQSSEDAITAVFDDKQFVFTFDKQLTADLVEAQRPATDVLVLSASDAAGATVCKAETIVDLPDKQCRGLDAAAARRIVEVLNGAMPYGAGSDCLEGDGDIYKVTLEDATDAAPITLSTTCGPAVMGDRRYRLDDGVAEAVAQEHDAAEQ